MEIEAISNGLQHENTLLLGIAITSTPLPLQYARV